MNPTLQQVMSDLKRLTLEEQWKLLGYLINQLRATVSLVARPEPELQTSFDLVDLDTLLEETRGSWGHLPIEEIDASLNRQRQLDWRE
ncbi:MAG: hypothetical protein HEQ35_03265 [Gloeotrichia echinulata IR180]|jgi:hypothetical protein